MDKITFSQFTLMETSEKMEALNKLYKKELSFETKENMPFEDMFKGIF